MLDIKFIRENKDAVKKNCRLRNIHCNIGRLLKLDDERKGLIQKRDKLLNEKKRLNEEMKNAANKEEIIGKGKLVKDQLSQLEPQLESTEKKWGKLLLKVPNISHPDSPIGKDDSENKEIERYGEPPKFDFEPKGHEELMVDLDIIDFKRGAKVAGAKFYFLKNEGALLEQALISFAFEKLIKKGFIPFITPDLAKDSVLLGIGYNPRGNETQIYSVENTDLNLVGTAEITMGGYHMDEMIDEEKLPLKYAAFSHCFRTEAGSYGRHSAGVYSVPQF